MNCAKKQSLQHLTLVIFALFAILPTMNIVSQTVTTIQETQVRSYVLFCTGSYRFTQQNLIPGIGGYSTYDYGSRLRSRLDVSVLFPKQYITADMLLGVHYYMQRDTTLRFQPYGHAGIGLAWQTNRNDIGNVVTDDPATSGMFDTKSIFGVLYRLGIGVQYSSFDVAVNCGFSPISEYRITAGLQVGYGF